MPEETTEQNADETQRTPAKKKSRKLLIIIGLFLILLLSGGGGFYYWRTRAASKAQAATDAAAKKAGLGTPPAKTAAAPDGDGDVTQVIELQPFIVNLADKNESRYLRMSISLGTGDVAETKVDPLYTTKIRNAILAIIGSRTSDQILTVEGKAALRRDMLNAARGAASKPEVLTIYITDFIIQM